MSTAMSSVPTLPDGDIPPRTPTPDAIAERQRPAPVTPRHILRSWPSYFQPVADGLKPFEVRYNDRGFQKGDTVVLREWNPWGACDCTAANNHRDNCDRYSGREVVATIGFVMQNCPGPRRVDPFDSHGYAVFSLTKIRVTW